VESTPNKKYKTFCVSTFCESKICVDYRHVYEKHEINEICGNE
jgi:hypothetical protein